MQEREIKLIDLLMEIFLHWRVVIAMALIGGAIGGTASYVISIKHVSEQKELLKQQVDAETELRNLEETLTEAEKYGVKAVINNERLNGYYNNSLLMRIDAANVPKMEMTFRITSDSLEESYNIEKIYEDLLSCGLLEVISNEEKTGISEAQLSELVVLNGSTNTLPCSAVTVVRDEGANRDSFQVTIMHVSEEACRELAESVRTYLEEQHLRLEEKIGTHEFNLINESFAYVTDAELLDQQRLMLTNINNSNTNVDKVKKAFSDLQTRYYTLLMGTSTENGAASQDNTLIVSPSLNVKYIVFGMVLFVILYVVYITVKCIFNTKLQLMDDVNTLYHIPLLGKIPQETSKKRWFGFVDRWVMRICNHNIRVFSKDEAIGLVSVALKIQMKKQEMSTVYCIGCNMGTHSMQLAEQIQSILSKEEITVNILDNILYNQEVMEKLQGAKAVFLMEKIGETLYDEVAKEKELLQRQDIKILGIVIAE